MRKLPITLQRIIKKKRFSLNTLKQEATWRGGMKIDYRITMVQAANEKYYDWISPTNSEYNEIYINIKVKGAVEMKMGNNYKQMVEIGRATKTTKNYWGGYDTKYDYLWGSQVNKAVRSEIRSKVKSKVKNYLKLMGITTKIWDGGIKIKNISWEK